MQPNIELRVLKEDMVESIQPLLQNSSFEPYRFLKNELGADLIEFWSNSINDVVSTPNSQGLIAFQNGTPLGLVATSINSWESDLLGKKAAVINALVVDGSIADRLDVASLLVNKAILQAKTQGVEFIQSKSYTNDLTLIHALELHGFLLMDTVVDCFFDYRRKPLESITFPIKNDSVILRLATLEDRNQLVDVAEKSFRNHFGRFHADEQIGHAVGTNAYIQWIHSSLDGYADWFHVAEISGKIAGFSIWKRPSISENNLKIRVGHYSIAGIDPDFFGQGLFTLLTFAGMQSLKGVADIIEGPTHINNYNVQLGYSKLGWRVLADARHTFHKWIT